MKTEVSPSYDNKKSQCLREKQYDVVTLREIRKCFIKN